MDKLQKITEERIFEIVADTGFKFDLLLKDYYVTVLLFLLKEVEGAYFKGGTALQKILLKYSRISEDIDYTITRPLAEVRKEIEGKVRASGIFGEVTRDKDVDGFVRLVVHYRGFKGEKGEIFIDINERGKVLLPGEKHPILHFYSNEIPAFTVTTLNSREMVAEKMAAAIGRNRPRDHFDLYQIVAQKIPLDLSLVKRKCELGMCEYDITKMFNQAKKLKNRWDQDLAPLLVKGITFQEVMKTLAHHFKLKQEKEQRKSLTKENHE